MSEEAVFTWEEIAKHNTEQDLWVVLHDKVYDVTNYQLEHPGGPIVLLNKAGKHATYAFEQASHSKNAIENVLPRYYKGKVDTGSVMQQWQKQEQYTGPSLLVTVLVAAIILGLVYVLAS